MKFRFALLSAVYLASAAVAQAAPAAAPAIAAAPAAASANAGRLHSAVKNNCFIITHLSLRPYFTHKPTGRLKTLFSLPKQRLFAIMRRLIQQQNHC